MQSLEGLVVSAFSDNQSVAGNFRYHHSITHFDRLFTDELPFIITQYRRGKSDSPSPLDLRGFYHLPGFTQYRLA
jgi:hypothetical protein